MRDICAPAQRRPSEAAFVVEEANVAVTFKNLAADTTDALAKLRLARELGLVEQAKIHERRLDYLLGQVPHPKENP